MDVYNNIGYEGEGADSHEISLFILSKESIHMLFAYNLVSYTGLITKDTLIMPKTCKFKLSISEIKIIQMVHNMYKCACARVRE